MRKRYPYAGTLIAVLALAACSQDSGRDFARYYDEQGLFIVDLPSANDITVAPPQPAEEGPGLLTGVVSSPPAPSPAPQSGFGLGVTAGEEPDQTTYRAFAVTSDGFTTLEEMTLFFVTGDPLVDVLIDDRARLDGSPARLVVADVVNGGQVTASIAVAVTLGDGGTGYLLAAIFPPGSWDSERRDFERVLASFHSDVPPGLATFPVVGPAS